MSIDNDNQDKDCDLKEDCRDLNAMGPDERQSFTGTGRHKSDRGTIREGEFVDGHLVNGIKDFAHVEVQQGTFEEGFLKEGSIRCINGTEWVGTFYATGKDLILLNGSVKLPGGEVRKGTFNHDGLLINGTQTGFDGRVVEYEDGEIVREQPSQNVDLNAMDENSRRVFSGKGTYVNQTGKKYEKIEGKKTFHDHCSPGYDEEGTFEDGKFVEGKLWVGGLEEYGTFDKNTGRLTVGIRSDDGDLGSWCEFGKFDIHTSYIVEGTRRLFYGKITEIGEFDRSSGRLIMGTRERLNVFLEEGSFDPSSKQLINGRKVYFGDGKDDAIFQYENGVPVEP
ncbi:hypothetical protein HY463_01345 [Candidatus Peregrinibacteria bacterium]|nr:hypothetical protein [Candidatus Peregrinibacteria bacterium]